MDVIANVELFGNVSMKNSATFWIFLSS